MRTLIARIREVIPLQSEEARRCSGVCHGCPGKLLEYLEMELEDWERRLARGDKPGLDDLSRLIETSKKVHRALQRQGIVE